MDEHDVRTSPRTYARIGGVLYLIIIAGGVFGEAFIRGRLIVSGDATATARNLVSSELLWRVGAASELFMLVCGVALTLIFYVLLRPVSRDLALLAVFFNLVTIALEAANELNLLVALFPLDNAGYLETFEPEQLHVLAQLPLRAYAYGFGNDLIFFGVACLVFGYLIYRSGYLPRAIGVLMALAGVSYLVNSFSFIIYPSLASVLFPAIMFFPLVGEGSLCVWLLVKGVDAGKWNERGLGNGYGRA